MIEKYYVNYSPLRYGLCIYKKSDNPNNTSDFYDGPFNTEVMAQNACFKLNREENNKPADNARKNQTLN